MLAIPFGPFVMLWSKMFSPLFVTVTNNCPKNSVTIAR